MAFPGWASLGGLEMWNHLRATTYLRTLQVGVETTGDICGTLGDFLDVDAYTTPSGDDAPWFDGLGDPHSSEFAGLVVTSISGLDNSSMSRAVTLNAGDGSSVGRLRRNARTVVVNGWLYGSTCCGTAAGLRWLSRALAEPDCPDGMVSGCQGTNFCFLDCCPPDDGAHGTPQQRFLHNVTCTDGPHVIGRWGRACGSCGGAERLNVEFTLTAADPYAYRAATNLVTNEDFGETDGTCIEWTTGACVDCTASDSPLVDPASGGATAPAPPILVPAYGGCVPLSSDQICLPIADLLIPDWAEGVPIITIHATSVLRNIVVGFSPAANDDLGCEAVEPCDFTSRFSIQYIPAGATMIIDGAKRLVTVTAGGVVYEASGMLLGLGGEPFDWPTLCCGPYCVCFDFPSGDGLAQTGSVTVDLVIRET